MKKWMMLIAIGLVAVVILGAAGLAFAQTQPPATPTTVPFGSGRMFNQTDQSSPATQGFMGRGRGMGGSQGQAGSGLIHDGMIQAMAETLGLAPEELQTRLDAGETLWTIAQEKGLSAEQLQAAMTQARTTALQQAVADGTLTQEQADFMSSRMNAGWASGYGPGSANCDGTGTPAGGRQGGGRRGGMRWNTAPAQ